MENQLSCDDPLNALARVVDVARRLNLTFDMLRMERDETGRHALCFALTEPESERARLFVRRIAQHSDFILGDAHV